MTRHPGPTPTLLNQKEHTTDAAPRPYANTAHHMEHPTGTAPRPYAKTAQPKEHPNSAAPRPYANIYSTKGVPTWRGPKAPRSTRQLGAQFSTPIQHFKHMPNGRKAETSLQQDQSSKFPNVLHANAGQGCRLCPHDHPCSQRDESNASAYLPQTVRRGLPQIANSCNCPKPSPEAVALSHTIITKLVIPLKPSKQASGGWFGLVSMQRIALKPMASPRYIRTEWDKTIARVRWIIRCHIEGRRPNLDRVGFPLNPQVMMKTFNPNNGGTNKNMNFTSNLHHFTILSSI